jgi:hypothetical protein
VGARNLLEVSLRAPVGSVSFRPKAPPVDPDAARIYYDFVVERHRIWEKRQFGIPAPWTTDPILLSRKFTNVYRVLDAGSQFLVRHLLDADVKTVALRCWLYRYTNRPEPWLAFAAVHGEMPTAAHVQSGALLEFWQGYQAQGLGLFSTAYQMFVGNENKGMDRTTWAVRQAQFFLDHYEPGVWQPGITMAQRASWLQTLPRCGQFMAMQIITDFGYSSYGADQDENSFVIAGPGSRVGVRAYGSQSPAEYVIERVTQEFREAGTVLLEGRPPSLMDIQNTMCEYSKFVRYRSLPPRLTMYTGHGDLPEPVLPAHWR